MSSDEVLKEITSEIKDCCKVYKELYKKVYGCTITKDLAEKWVKSMTIPALIPSSNGEKWNYETSVELGNKMNIDWNEISKIDWYVVLNMMYSDMYMVAKSVDKQSDAIFFGNMAKEWLLDDDVDCTKKLYNYYFNVVCS